MSFTRVLLMILVSTHFLLSAHAQNLSPCVTEISPDQMRYLEETKTERRQFNARTTTTWISVQVHIVNPTSGSGGLAVNTLNRLMGALNLEYYHSNIQFYYCNDPLTINSSQIYDFDFTDDILLTNQYDVANVMNVYFTNTITSNGISACGYAFFPGGPDHIVIANGCTADNSTFIHEWGHALSLYHTHGKTNFGITDELVNGSNCATAGDDVCDTPADPNLLGLVSGCTYIGNLADINGDIYAPETDNIMSYAPSNCRTNLSAGQKNRAAYSANNDRPYLSCASLPACANPIPILGSPYFESFESGLNGWTNVDDAFYASLGLQQFDFTINSGSTPTVNTGPSTASDGINYALAEATGNVPNHFAFLQSPCFDFSNMLNPKMSLKLHMYGTQVSRFIIQVSVDGGFNWSAPVLQLIGDQGNAWVTHTIDLAEYKNARGVQVRLWASTSALGDIGDIAVDEVNVWEDNVVTCPPAGTACDDNDPATYNDIEDGNCGCTGTPCPTAGTSCDDNDPNTINDVEDGFCNCAGTAAPSCTNVVIASDNFDSGWGIWNDGGSDCRRSTKDAAYAYSGNRCVRLRDDSGTSNTTTDNLNLSSFDTLTIDFTYITRSMDNSNEDFYLEISTNGGASYAIVEEWNLNDEFVNNVREFESVDIVGPFSSNTKLRFRCDASGNSDWVYLDDIIISGCDNGGASMDVQLSGIQDDQTQATESPFIPIESELLVYPNPATEFVKVKAQLPSGTYYMSLVALDGKVVMERSLVADGSLHTYALETSGLPNGMYIISIEGNGQLINERLLITK